MEPSEFPGKSIGDSCDRQPWPGHPRREDQGPEAGAAALAFAREREPPELFFFFNPAAADSRSFLGERLFFVFFFGGGLFSRKSTPRPERPFCRAVTLERLCGDSWVPFRGVSPSERPLGLLRIFGSAKDQPARRALAQGLKPCNRRVGAAL